MQLSCTTPEEYLALLPEERRAVVQQIRNTILVNLPSGFEEVISSGMLGYVIPHTLYPPGYHCDRKQPLPYMYLASQKNFIAVYHMGLYADPEMYAWFTSEYPKRTPARLDMGKSCIRFKKPGDIPLDLIGELAGKMTPDQWIALYEKLLKK
jgi:hypothetical protein